MDKRVRVRGAVAVLLGLVVMVGMMLAIPFSSARAEGDRVEFRPRLDSVEEPILPPPSADKPGQEAGSGTDPVDAPSADWAWEYVLLWLALAGAGAGALGLLYREPAIQGAILRLLVKGQKPGATDAVESVPPEEPDHPILTIDGNTRFEGLNERGFGESNTTSGGSGAVSAGPRREVDLAQTLKALGYPAELIPQRPTQRDLGWIDESTFQNDENTFQKPDPGTSTDLAARDPGIVMPAGYEAPDTLVEELQPAAERDPRVPEILTTYKADGHLWAVTMDGVRDLGETEDRKPELITVAGFELVVYQYPDKDKEISLFEPNPTPPGTYTVTYSDRTVEYVRGFERKPGKVSEAGVTVGFVSASVASTDSDGTRVPSVGLTWPPSLSISNSTGEYDGDPRSLQHPEVNGSVGEGVCRDVSLDLNTGEVSQDNSPCLDFGGSVGITLPLPKLSGPETPRQAPPGYRKALGLDQ